MSVSDINNRVSPESQLISGVESKVLGFKSEITDEPQKKTIVKRMLSFLGLNKKKTPFNNKARLKEILNYKSSIETVKYLKDQMNITEPSFIGKSIDIRTSDPALREMETLKVISSHNIDKVFKRLNKEVYSGEVLTLVLTDGTKILLEPELLDNDGAKFIKLIVKNIKVRGKNE